MNKAVKLVVSAAIAAAGACCAMAADTMYWYKSAPTTDFFDLANWRVENESGATTVSALATNVGDTAVFQKTTATVDVPAGTTINVGNMTVGIAQANTQSDLTMNFGKDAALVGSGKLSIPANLTAYKTLKFNCPEGGLFSFPGGVDLGRHGYVDFTGTGIVVTNTPTFKFGNADGDNRVTFPSGTTMYGVEVVTPNGLGGTFTFSVAGPNSVIKGFKHDWGTSSSLLTTPDVLLAITNGVTMTDVNIGNFRGFGNRLLLDDVTADLSSGLTVKDSCNRVELRRATVTGGQNISINGNTNALIVADSSLSAGTLSVGGNAQHRNPFLFVTNSALTGTSISCKGLESRLEAFDSQVDLSGGGSYTLSVGGAGDCAGSALVSGPKTRLTVPLASTAGIGISADGADSASGSSLVVSNKAVVTCDRLRVGGYAGVNDLKFWILDGAVVTNTLFRFCNTAGTGRGGERCELVIDGSTFVNSGELRFAGSNNLVRVANGGRWEQNGPNTDNEMIGGGYAFEIDDATVEFKRGFPLSSEGAMESTLKISGARGAVSCEKLNSVGAEITFAVPKTGRTTDAPMLTLTQYNALPANELFPSDWNVSLKFELPNGLTRETAGAEYVDLIDISHFKGQVDHFLDLTNSVDQASLKGCKLEYTTGSGGLANAKLRLHLPKKPTGLILLLK